jgi:hypothetical protein
MMHGDNKTDMVMRGFDLHAQAEFWNRQVNFRLFKWVPLPGGNTIGSERKFAMPDAEGNLIFTSFIEGSALPVPSFALSESNAQWLMDSLYQAGLRPSQHQHQPTGALEAHLQDMRAIVADKLKVSLPPARGPK